MTLEEIKEKKLGAVINTKTKHEAMLLVKILGVDKNRADRTCSYCGKVCDTIEDKNEHESWHVERRKARHERYLLRKRAKEIAFEEAAQKLAKEIMNEKK